MFAQTEIQKYRQTDQGTDLLIHIPRLQLEDIFKKKAIRKAEIRFDDGRHISAEQRKKAYATINDISAYTGYLPEEQKEWLKYLHISQTGCEYFSLSNCTMDRAREFINTILEYAISEGIQLTDAGVERTDAIGKYLYFCIKHKKCCVCGQAGEVHHEDAIGMGNDRRKFDDSENRKMCLCRYHHTLCHQMGTERFENMYKVYGIVIKNSYL